MIYLTNANVPAKVRYNGTVSQMRCHTILLPPCYFCRVYSRMVKPAQMQDMSLALTTHTLAAGNTQSDCLTCIGIAHTACSTWVTCVLRAPQCRIMCTKFMHAFHSLRIPAPHHITSHHITPLNNMPCPILPNPSRARTCEQCKACELTSKLNHALASLLAQAFAADLGYQQGRTSLR